jgi:hypothetical protein
MEGENGIVDLINKFENIHGRQGELVPFPNTEPEMLAQQLEDKELAAIALQLEGSILDDNNMVSLTLNNYHYRRFKIDGIWGAVLIEKKHIKLGDCKYAVVVASHLIKPYLKQFHDGGGHRGIARSIDTIRKKYWWPEMNNDIKFYIQRCRFCGLRKSDIRRAVVPIQAYDQPTHPFEVGHMDMTGKLPTTRSGNNFILIIICKLTKFPELIPCVTNSALEVAGHLVNEIYMRYGPMQLIITDKGGENINKIMKEIHKLLRTKHINTTGYNPRSNGAVETVNRPVKDMLAAYANAKQDDWDEYLSVIAFGQRSMVNSTTGYSPAMALYGRELRTPGESWIAKYLDKHKDIHVYVKELATTLQLIWQDIEITMGKAFKSYSKPHHERRPIEFVPFEVGDMVYRKTVPKSIYKYYLDKKEYKIIRKLQHRYTGPFKIIKVWSPVRYRISEHGKPKEVHMINLKKAPKSNRLSVERNLELIEEEE